MPKVLSEAMTGNSLHRSEGKAKSSIDAGFGFVACQNEFSVRVLGSANLPPRANSIHAEGAIRT